MTLFASAVCVVQREDVKPVIYCIYKHTIYIYIERESAEYSTENSQVGREMYKVTLSAIALKKMNKIIELVVIQAVKTVQAVKNKIKLQFGAREIFRGSSAASVFEQLSVNTDNTSCCLNTL